MVLLKENFRSFGEAESLARFGFNPQEKITSLNHFSQQMESHALHVIEDRPVSNAYSYFIDNGQIYIDRENKTKLFIDHQERDGFSLFGVEQAVKKALFNPGQIVFLYSPPGPVVFKTGTRYDKMKPYPDGQLYLLIGNNSNQVDAIAISVSKEQEEKTLTTFLGREKTRIGYDDEIEKIKYFLTHSTITNWNIDDFLIYLEGVSHLNNFSVYENVHKEEFKLSDVLTDLRRGWVKEIKPKIKIDYRQLFNMALRGDVRGAYTSQLQNSIYLSLYGENGKIKLGGGCGGNDGDEKVDLLSDIRTDPLSTNYRLKTPSIKDIFKSDKDSDEYGSLKFHCPVCNGEHTRPRHKLLEKCPNKGKEIPKC